MRGSPLVRYLVIGGLAVLLNLALFWLLVGLLGWHYLAATVVVFFVSNLAGFVANRRLTFRSNGRPAPELVRWYAVMGVSLLANLAAMALLVDGIGLNYLLASPVLSLLFAVVNFTVHDRFTFGRTTA